MLHGNQERIVSDWGKYNTLSLKIDCLIIEGMLLREGLVFLTVAFPQKYTVSSIVKTGFLSYMLTVLCQKML